MLPDTSLTNFHTNQRGRGTCSGFSQYIYIMPVYCQHCKKTIKSANVTTLELSNTDNQYYKVEIPKGHVSQGAFDFHPHCAVKQLKDQPDFTKRHKYCIDQHDFYSGLAASLESDIDRVNRPVHVPYEGLEDANVLTRAVAVLRRRATQYKVRAAQLLSDLEK